MEKNDQMEPNLIAERGIRKQKTLHGFRPAEKRDRRIVQKLSPGLQKLWLNSGGRNLKTRELKTPITI